MENEPETKKFIEADDYIKQSSSSFKLVRNKSGVTIEVKVYACDSSEQIKHAREEAENNFSELVEKYE